MGENNQFILEKGRSQVGLTFFLLSLLIPLALWGGWWSLDMFVDGLTYGSVARNWSMGEGELWSLHYTAALYPKFVEHPPLFFYLEGFLFKIFGDTTWIEELMSSLVWIGFILVFYLSSKESKSRTSILTVSMIGLLLIPNLGWAFQNNMLEPLMILWFILAIFSYSRAIRKESLTWAALAALFSFFAVLTKGVVAIPILLWPGLILLDKRGDTRSPLYSYYLVIFILVGLLAIYPPSRAFWVEYFDKQVIGSMNQASNGPALWQRLLDLFTGLGTVGVIVFMSHRFGWLRKIYFQKSEWVLMFLNVIPWLLFSKYHPHYWLPVFVLSWYFISRGLVVEFMKYKNLALIASLIICAAIGAISSSSSRPAMGLAMSPTLKAGQEVKVSYQLCEDWYLHGAFQRAKKIDLKCVARDEAQLTHSDHANCASGLTIDEYNLCL